MKRKFFVILLTLISVFACAFGVAACQFKVNNVNLSFVVDGQTVATVETSGKEVIAIPDNPEKEGYTFDGWYWDEGVWSNSFTANSLLNAPISSDMNVYAKMTPIQYSIAYNLDGGSNTNPTSYTIETSTITLTDAVKVGYTFNGWYKESSFSNKVTSISQGSIGNVELYAKFTINQYTISFDTDGGNAVGNITQDFNSSISAPSDPIKSGYDFVGWYLDSSETAYIFSTMPAEDISLKAKWVPKEYSITYILNGGTNDENPVKFTIETNTIILADATRAGYTFNGWYNGSNKVTEIEAGTIGNITLTADWTPIEYTIAYENTKLVDNSNPVKFTIESDTITLINLEKIGYTFNGWYNGSNKITEIATGTIGNITLTANWTVNGYEITYHNVDGAIINNPDVYNVEDEPLTLVDASKNGYIFCGWYTDADFNDKIEVISLGTIGDKDIYAKWEIIEYTITYIYDSTQGNLATGDSLKTIYTVEDDFDFATMICSVEGYEFSGWYTEKVLGTGTKYSGISLGTTGNKTFYAQWSPAVYTITYHNIENVTNTNPITYTIETEDFSIDSVSKVGYTFDGWYSDSTLENVADTKIVKGSHGNIDYYAKWTAKTYSITYNLYGGFYAGNDNPTSYTIEDNISLINPTQNGKYFVGWYSLAENGDLITTINGMTGNITLYARWLTFDSKGGSTVNYELAFSEAGVTEPNEPTKDYYEFAGWFFDEQFSNEYYFTSLPIASSTLYAKWIATNYTITYILNEGINNSANPSTYTIEDTIVFEQPSKTGYTFNGWYSDELFTSALVTGVTVGSHGDITIYANFGINQYTIGFDSNGGTSVDDIRQNYATNVLAPADPAKTGYEFGGWYSDSELKYEYTFTTVPAYDFTLYAKWNLVDYQIKYNLDGGSNSTANPEIYTIENSTIVLANPIKIGYDFMGWYTDNSYSDVKTEIVCGSYGDIELFARWQIITYTINYIVPDNTVNENILEYTIITNSTQLNDAMLSGYTFNGWYSNEQYTESVLSVGGGSVGNITLYGKFSANKYNVWLDGNEQANCIVSFNLNGASGIAPATQTITETNTLVYPAIPTRSGYLFCGWYSNSECIGEPYDFSGLVGADTTLYAKWESIGSANVININSSETVQLSGTTEKIYKFIPLVSGNVSMTSTGSIDTLGSLYKGNTLLKMDDDSGSDSNFLIVYNVTAGEVYDIHVRGFSSSTDGSITLTLTGVAEIAQGGYTKSGNKLEVTYGSSFKLSVPEAEGNYKFLGWQDINGVLYTDAQGNSIINWDKAADSVLYSKWEKMEYTVTFATNGGSSIESVTLEYGARLDLNSFVTTRDNYTFSGWYLSASDAEPYSAGTMPDHNITLYAKWTTFALGTIKYDEDKKAISVNDTISPELFNAICLDTNGNLATFTATISGTQSEGNIVSIRLVATSGNKTKQVTIADVKVYGMPTLTISNTNVDYVNIVGGLTAEWFGASGTDTFGESTEILVKVADGYSGGDIGSVIIESIDASGNIASQTVDNIKLYDLPQITYNVNKTAISSTDNIVATLFDATAQDSFGESVNVEVTYEAEYIYTTSTNYKFNYFTAESTGAYYLYFKNGESGARTYLSVYCVTTDTYVISESYNTNTSYAYKSFNVVEGNEYRVGTKAYSSSYVTDYYMYLATGASSTSNRISLFTGKCMSISLTATDSKGNVRVIDLNVDVYGKPKFITESIKTEFKESDDITVDALGLTAEDTYRNNLEISLSIKSGTQIGGEIMIYTATIVDAANNKVQKDIDVKIYGTPTLAYNKEGLSVTNDLSLSPNVTILYYLNYEGAPSMQSQTIGVGDSVAYPQIPERKGYVFRGWFIDKECTQIYDFSATLVNSLKLYAGWIEAASSYRTIDIVNNYNSSSDTLNLGIGNSLTELRYTYFRIYNDGNYTVYYKGSHYSSYSSHSVGSQYIEIVNVVTNTTIKASTKCSFSSYSSCSFEAKAGDVICLISQGLPCTYKNAYGGTVTSYCSPEVYILGGTAPQDGGTVSSDCVNHLKGMENIFNAIALDSFGNSLDVTVSFKSGDVAIGSSLIYVLSATDHLGNTISIDTMPLGIYDVNDIIFSYSNMASDIIKVTSKGEEFFASATDTFGNACDITIVPAEGFELKGGEIIDLYIVATDKAGNSVKSELISGIKVYDMPKLQTTFDEQVIEESTDISFLFNVFDSFGEEIFANVTTDKDIQGGEFIKITVTAQDDAGNIIEKTFDFVVLSDSKPYVELYVNNSLWKQVILDNSTEKQLPVPEITGKNFYGWIDSHNKYFAYNDGNVVAEMQKLNKLYAIFYDMGSQTIANLDELKAINLNDNYVLVNDIDLSGIEWSTLGNFEGIFDGNGFEISNLTITESAEVKAGLFSINAGTIKNLSLSNIAITTLFYPKTSSTTQMVGGIASKNNGTIENCFVSGSLSVSFGSSHFYYDSMTVYAYGGAITGNNEGTIKNCYSDCTINVYAGISSSAGSSSSYSYAGGIAGYNNGVVSSCYSKNTVSASAGASGSSSTIIYASSYSGGIVGYNNNLVSNSFSIGEISASSSRGGSNYGSANKYLGGVVGYNYKNGTITNCYLYDEQSYKTGTTVIEATNSEGEVVTMETLLSSTFIFDKLSFEKEKWCQTEGNLPILYFR